MRLEEGRIEGIEMRSLELNTHGDAYGFNNRCPSVDCGRGCRQVGESKDGEDELLFCFLAPKAGVYMGPAYISVQSE